MTRKEKIKKSKWHDEWYKRLSIVKWIVLYNKGSSPSNHQVSTVVMTCSHRLPSWGFYHSSAFIYDLNPFCCSHFKVTNKLKCNLLTSNGEFLLVSSGMMELSLIAGWKTWMAELHHDSERRSIGSRDDIFASVPVEDRDRLVSLRDDIKTVQWALNEHI